MKLATITLLLLLTRSSAQQPSVARFEQCQEMKPSPVRTQCLVAAQRMAAAEKALIASRTTYTVVLYAGGGEVGRWETKELTQMNGAVEFTDLSSNHRWRVDGTYTIESSTDRIMETPTEEQEEAD